MIGRRLGRLTVTAKLGRGGMGTVYLAVEDLTGAAAAIKVLAESLSGDPGILKRFELEQQIVGDLVHPHIVRGLGGVMSEGGVHYFVMEYVPGANLARILRALGRLTPAESVAVALQVCDALTYAHARGIVHRDLKPSNLLIDPAGVARVTDFGLAKVAEFTRVTLSGQVLGTPEYMSPEQAEGKPADARSDLYAVGVMLFEMLTGRPPFLAENPLALLRKHCEEPAPRPSGTAPDVPESLDRVVLRCLEKDPFRRYESANDLASDLRAAAAPAGGEEGDNLRRLAGVVRSSSADPTQPYLASPATPGTAGPLAGSTLVAGRAAGPALPRTGWVAAVGVLGGLLVWILLDGMGIAPRGGSGRPSAGPGNDRAITKSASEARPAELILVGGSTARGTVLQLDSRRIRFRGEDGRETEYALDQVESIRYRTDEE